MGIFLETGLVNETHAHIHIHFLDAKPHGANNHYESEWWATQASWASPGRHQGRAGILELCGTSEMTYPRMPFTGKGIKFRETDRRQSYSAHL